MSCITLKQHNSSYVGLYINTEQAVQIHFYQQTQKNEWLYWTEQTFSRYEKCKEL